MRNWMLLTVFLLLFGFLVSNYPKYADNTFAVALATAVILYSGLAVWVISVQKRKPDEDN